VRPSRYSRKEILQKLSEVFRREGYNGASLADLAAAVGQGKASLYQKFPGGKAQIGAEVLAEIQQTFETRVLATLREQGTPDVRFKKMLDAACEFYGDGNVSCLVETLSLGEAGELYRSALHDAVQTWRKALIELARAAGHAAAKANVWAEEVLISIQGALVLARATKDPQIFRRALERLEHDFAA
jgi:TetR/AcrR family transcriptional regulator, lmrAB and yxaGH operons repressor